MKGRNQPATLVLCATAPRQGLTGRSRAWLEAVRGVAVPVTWAVGIDTLAEVAGQADGLDLALDIPPAAESLKGVRMELIDSAFPLLQGTAQSAVRPALLLPLL